MGIILVMPLGAHAAVSAVTVQGLPVLFAVASANRLFRLGSCQDGFPSMQALECVALVLVSIALVIHLFEKGLGYWREHRRLHRLVNCHPEMKGVHPDEDSLFVFESDDSLKALVLNNEEPGASEPFYDSEDDLG